MSDRCAESIQMRRGQVSLRCDRKAGHATGDDRDALWHFDMSVNAWWCDQWPLWGEEYIAVRYEIEGGT